jgi:hypothetical protein
MPSITSNSAYTKEDAYKTLERNISWINSADTKASIMIGVISFVFGGSSVILNPTRVHFLFEANTFWSLLFGIFIGILFMVSLGSFLATIVSLVLVLVARTTPPDNRPIKNFLFFNDISKLSFKEFGSLTSKLTEQEFFDDLNSQIHITSTIATMKYKFLSKAYWLMAVSSITFATTVLILHYLPQ